MKKKIETSFFCKTTNWSRRMIKIKKIVYKVLLIGNFNFKKNNYFLNLIFVNDKIIKKINRIYRNKNQSTDVLTFITLLKNDKIKHEAYCDIFFSAETIKEDAKKNSINFYDHLTHLVIHCLLHVDGYDHKKKAEFIKMKNLEEKILIKLGIKSPYII